MTRLLIALALCMHVVAAGCSDPAPQASVSQEQYHVRLVFTDFDETVRLAINGREVVQRVMTNPEPSTGLSAIVEADLGRENLFHLTTSRGVDLQTPVTVGPNTRVVYVTRTVIQPSDSELVLD